MQLSKEASHRLTAILCTLVAVAILAAGVTAQHETGAPVDVLARLESDLRFQVRSVFRLRPRDASKRLGQIDKVLNEFRENGRSKDDQQLMADWLLRATRRSMPGSLAPLPETPEFGRTNLPTTSQQDAASAPVPSDTTPAAQIEPSVETEASNLERPRETTSAPKPSQTNLPSSPPVERLVAPKAATTQLVSSAEATLLVQPEQSEVVLNLNELSARIAGYHLALDELEADLFENPQPNEAEIGRFLKQLASVLEDYHFVNLYYESLNAPERSQVTAPRSVGGLVTGIKSRIQKLRRAIQTDFLGEFDRSDAERVEQLSSQLRVLADRITW